MTSRAHTHMHVELAEQPEVLDRLVQRFDDDADTLSRLLPEPPQAVVLLARGSSDNAATLGRYLLELATGRPVALAAPSLLTRYAAPVRYDGVLVVGISQSGRTPEIADALSRLRSAGGRTIAVTNDTSSPLAEAAHLVLPLLAGPETAVPATKTVTAQFLRMITIAAALGDIGVGMRELTALPGAVAELLTDDQPICELAARWSGTQTLLVAARGLLLAAAQETALKIRETAGITALGTSSADLLHGPIAAVRSGDPALLLGGDPHTTTDIEELAARLAAMGTDLAAIGTADAAITLPAGLHPCLRPIAATVRGQQLALELALNRGLDPDAPAGLSKVTVTR